MDYNSEYFDPPMPRIDHDPNFIYYEGQESPPIKFDDQNKVQIPDFVSPQRNVIIKFLI
jgi:hypothetical protein